MSTSNISASIIAMAYPEAFVIPSNEGICKIVPYLGMGSKEGIKVGHAALCLINHDTSSIDYYDFGRYITPLGSGRVRSVNTDEELHVPVQAIVEGGSVKNIEEILLWLEKHPEKTHGDGALFASVCSSINYEKAHKFITEIHTKGSIPYGVFITQGTNCSRFVYDTIMESCEDSKVTKKLKSENLITPSPLGVVSKVTANNTVYKIMQGIVTKQKPFTTLGIWKYFFDKPKKTTSTLPDPIINNAQKLAGIGSNAYFTLEATPQTHEYRITRYNDHGDIDCQNIFTVEDTSFDANRKYQFVYDSNCDHCHIVQGDIVYRFNKK